MDGPVTADARASTWAWQERPAARATGGDLTGEGGPPWARLHPL